MLSSQGTTWSTRFTARRDLRIQSVETSNHKASYNVLDPLTRQSYRIGEFERRVLQLVNGRRSLQQIYSLLRGELATTGECAADLAESNFLAVAEQLRKTGLILAPRLKTGAAPLQRLQNTVTQVQAFVSSLVVWQIRGLQPDRWLGKIAPHTDWLFSGAAVRLWMTAAVVTLIAVLLEFPRLFAQSMAWDWVIQPLQGSALFVVFLVTRALHELGHAIACKRQGVRCPDIGIFVILGAPCVYCDVSESWHLPSRWQRAAVAAAGMYVEAIVATLAAWVWILTVDSPLNTLALQTMFVCSISTIVINANPLMRFDGYYLLSDLLDHSNLRDKADRIAIARIYRWVLGKRGAESQQLTVADQLLSLFSWSSWIYRAGLSLVIAGVLASIYASWHLAWIGRLVGVSILISWWGVPMMKFASDIARTAWRTGTTARLVAMTLLLAIGMSLIPIPYRQFARGWVQPLQMQGVYVSTAGHITESFASSGTLVTADMPLFQMENSSIESAAVQRAGELHKARLERAAYGVESLVAKSVRDAAALDTALANAERQLTEVQQEQERLTLKSPSSGRLMILPAARPAGVSEVDTQSIVYDWDDLTQRQRFVEAGAMLAAVCSSQQVAVMPLDDEQLQWIAEGTPVRLYCPGSGPEVIQCSVSKIGDLTEDTGTWRLINLQAAESSSTDQNRPSGTSPTAARVARIYLPDGKELPVGATIEAAFVAPTQTVASIGYRWLQKNLRWLAD